MKVAYFTNHLGQIKGHGIARYAKKLLKSITDVDPNIILSPVSTIKKENINNFDYLNKEFGLSLLPWGRYLTALSWSILKRPYIEHWIQQDFDILHSPNLGYPVPTKKPFAITVHDIGPLTRPEFFDKLSIHWMKIGFPYMINHASAIICVSRSTADEIISAVGSHIGKRVFVTHEGVDPKFFDHPDPNCFNLLSENIPNGLPFLLAVGGISPRKNIIRILRAMEVIKDKIPHHLVLVGGSGWDENEVFNHIQGSQIKNRIHHLGYVSDEELHSLYCNADAFIYPSLFEGFGLPVLEAMASGCPVITSNVYSMPEIAGNAAVLVNPLSVEDIASAVLMICSQKALSTEMKDMGIAQAKRFTWNRCAKETCEIYRAII